MPGGSPEEGEDSYGSEAGEGERQEEDVSNVIDPADETFSYQH